jgi:hypothetical protein
MNARVLRPKINALKNTNILKTFDYRGLPDNSENPENGVFGNLVTNLPKGRLAKVNTNRSNLHVDDPP